MDLEYDIRLAAGISKNSSREVVGWGRLVDVNVNLTVLEGSSGSRVRSPGDMGRKRIGRGNVVLEESGLLMKVYRLLLDLALASEIDDAVIKVVVSARI